MEKIAPQKTTYTKNEATYSHIRPLINRHENNWKKVSTL